MMTIGIGITTRNRSEILNLVLKQLFSFWPEANTKLVIVDDSDEKLKHDEILLDSEHAYVDQLVQFNQRLGIARAKNECLRDLKGCDHIFLFDDDIYPIRAGWEKLFTESGQNHLMYLTRVGEIQPLDELVYNHRTIFRPEGFEVRLTRYSNCMGCMLYLTKKTLEIVGAFNEQFGIYGFEHADYSRRCMTAGLAHGYFSPSNVTDYLYSLDYEVNNNSQPLPDSISRFNSSLEGEDVQKYIDQNRQVYTQSPKIYQSL